MHVTDHPSPSEDSGRAIAQTPAVSEPYRVEFHNVGGREPDGEPTFIGPWTFRTKMVRDVVKGALTGRVFNACAGKTRLSHDDRVIRNDINTDRDAHYHYDVANIDEWFDAGSFDTVVFDPPFDQAQADEHYSGMHDRQRGPARRKLADLVRPGGVFIELGWNDHGPALQSQAWTRREMHHYRRGPSYQPVFLTIDERQDRQGTLTEAVADA